LIQDSGLLRRWRYSLQFDTIAKFDDAQLNGDESGAFGGSVHGGKLAETTFNALREINRRGRKWQLRLDCWLCRVCFAVLHKVLRELVKLRF
jgi:hypothetical protein